MSQKVSIELLHCFSLMVNQNTSCRKSMLCGILIKVFFVLFFIHLFNALPYNDPVITHTNCIKLLNKTFEIKAQRSHRRNTKTNGFLNRCLLYTGEFSVRALKGIG